MLNPFTRSLLFYGSLVSCTLVSIALVYLATNRTIFSGVNPVIPTSILGVYIYGAVSFMNRYRSRLFANILSPKHTSLPLKWLRLFGLKHPSRH